MTDHVSLSIVEALADAEDTESEDVDYTLEEYIDTDALAQLVAHETASWTLSFEVLDREVTVRSDGHILVDGRKKGTWTESHPSAGESERIQ